MLMSQDESLSAMLLLKFDHVVSEHFDENHVTIKYQELRGDCIAV
jgi:hypothetical protein